MADVYRPPPAIDVWLRKAEKYARRYDKPLVLCICIMGVLLAGFIALEIFTSRSTVTWVGQEWTPSAPSSVVPLDSRRDQRSEYRVRMALHSACNDLPEDTVFAVQVTVDGTPMEWKMARICPLEVDVVNPTVLASGENEVQCRDDHNGDVRTKTRPSPITVSSVHTGVTTLTEVHDICAWMYTIDMLDFTW